MSVPSILSKGCVPELSLVGSRVAVLEPRIYLQSLVQNNGGSVDRGLTILPDISGMPASPHHERPDAATSGFTSTQSLLGSPHSLIMTHGDLLNTSRLAYQGQSWPGLGNHHMPTDADVINQARRLERYMVSNKIQLNSASPAVSHGNRTPLGNKNLLGHHGSTTQTDHHGNTNLLEHRGNTTQMDHHDNTISLDHCGNSSPLESHGNRTPLDQMTRRTWHSELLRETSKISSHSSRQGSCSSHNDSSVSRNEVEDEARRSTTASTDKLSKDKLRKEKKRKKKKSPKVNVNKVSRTKVKFKSAGHSRSLPSSKLTNSYHGNKDTLMIAQCTAIKVLPTPPTLPKPVITPNPFVTNHAKATQKQYKLMMGAVVSVSATNTPSQPFGGSAKLTAPKAIESLLHVSVHNKSADVATMIVQSQPTRIIKVFCSDKQSGVLKELGIERPCAPPSTPMPELLTKYEYIPSMNDIRSQRTVKVRLEAIGKVEKVKQEKVKEEKQKYEKLALKEKDKERRKRQRLEIYALNKIMTEFENANFMEFCRKTGLKNK